MPLISRIGAKSLKVRVTYGMMFLVLVLGAITMVYPLALMVAGSFKSETDIGHIGLYPRFWFNDIVLFQKYAESKYNMALQDTETAWWQRVNSWRNIKPPSPEDAKYLDEFLAWRSECKWWWLGHSRGIRLETSVNSREFRREMYERFDGDIQSLQSEMKAPVRTWSWFLPPGRMRARFPQTHKPLFRAFIEFARTRPVRDRMIENPDGMFWYRYLAPTYTDEIDEYNRVHGTTYASYQEVFLTRRAPQHPLQRKDWEIFVREILPGTFIRLSPDLAGPYRRFLGAKYLNDIEEYIRSHPGSTYSSFDDIPLPTAIPERRSDQVDYLEFIGNDRVCPIEGIEVYGPRQAFEEHLARRAGMSVEELGPVRLPLAAADWHDCMSHTGELRWEFTSRNYKHVLNYILLHGRGVTNTLVYCALAIGLALLVNPLAAYALSRYKPPSTYAILLFCLATMAFPGEVTIIPSFLLLKRFPLWPLIAGGITFGLSLWIFSKGLKQLPELFRMALALCLGILAGVWLVPAMGGKPTISLLNTFAALVLPGMANGFMIFLLKGFFDSLPRELYEQADIDGASEWTKFWTLTMALSKPVLAIAALNAFFAAYTALMMLLIIIPDEKMWTIMIWLFNLQYHSHQAVVYASVVLAAVPTLVVLVLCQRIIIRGIVVPVEK